MRRRSTSLTSGRWSSVFWPPDARRAAVPRMVPGRPRALQRPWALAMSSVIAVPDRAMPPFPAGAMLRLRYRLRIGPSEAQDMNSPNRPSINRAHRSPPRAASTATPQPTTTKINTQLTCNHAGQTARNAVLGRVACLDGGVRRRAGTWRSGGLCRTCLPQPRRGLGLGPTPGLRLGLASSGLRLAARLGIMSAPLRGAVRLRAALLVRACRRRACHLTAVRLPCAKRKTCAQLSMRHPQLRQPEFTRRSGS